MINFSFTRTALNNQTNTPTSLEVTGVRYDDPSDSILITVGVKNYQATSPTYTIDNVSFSSTSTTLSLTTALPGAINFIRVGDTVTSTSSSTVVPVVAKVETFSATIVPGLDFLIANAPITSLPMVGEVLVNPELAANTKVTRIQGNRVHLDKVVPSTSNYNNTAVVDYQSLLRVVSINTTNNTVTLNRNFGGTGSDVASITFSKFIYNPALYTLKLQHLQSVIDNLNVTGAIFFETNPSTNDVVGGNQLPVIGPNRRGNLFGSSFINLDEFFSALRIPRINTV